MPYVKTPTVLADAVTMTAGAGNVTYPTTAPTYVDLSTVLSAVVNIKLTNGATGPTIPAQVQVEIADDTSVEWFALGNAYIGATANNAVSTFAGIELPVSATAVRFVTGSNTAQDVTLNLSITVLEEA